MSREQVYDEQINPLLAQIIALCKEHDIPLFASFQLDDKRPAEAGFMCTTSILPNDSEPALRRACAEVYGPQRIAGSAISTLDASGKILAQEVFFP